MSKTLPSSLSISSRVLLRKRKPFTGWNACSMKLWSQTRCSIWNGTPQCLTRSCYQYFNLSLRSLKNVRRRYRLWIRLILFITLFPGSSKTMTRTLWKKSNLHNFPLYFQWDIIVRRSSLINAYNLPHYGYEPWKSLHDFDEIYEKKFGKLLVIVTQSYSTTWIFISSVVRNLFLFYGSTD